MSSKQYIWVIRVLVLVTVTAVGITIWSLFFRKETTPIAPDYAPREEEVAAKPIPNEGDTKLDAPENGSAVSLTYSDQVTLDLSEESATLMFANPSRSKQDMLLQIIVHDTIVVQSGRILPGNQVTELELLSGVVEKLSPGGYDGSFIISFYDPESREKALVNTEIPITITVNP
jgi:hypothetical protein